MSGFALCANESGRTIPICGRVALPRAQTYNGPEIKEAATRVHLGFAESASRHSASGAHSRPAIDTKWSERASGGQETIPRPFEFQRVNERLQLCIGYRRANSGS